MKKLLLALALFLSTSCYADTNFGDWVVVTVDNNVIARTTNGDSETTGVFCSADGSACEPYVILNNECPTNKKQFY